MANYEKMYDLFDLAFAMQETSEGLSLEDIEQKYNVSRRTAERMRNALMTYFPQMEEVATGELPFLLTSCCPSWSMLAKKFFPETIDKISNALTPMVATARVIKKEHPDASVVFIGPCVAKKLEASRRSVRSDE